MKHMFLLGLAATVLQSQTVPLGVIVTVPSSASESLAVGAPLPSARILLLTRALPGGAVAAVTANSSAAAVTIWNMSILSPSFFALEQCATLRLPACIGTTKDSGPDFYPIPDASSVSLSAAVPLTATITPRAEPPFMVSTTPFVTGVEQSADGLTITVHGAFDPTAQITVYFGLWPASVAAHAVTVEPDRVTIDLTKDHRTFDRGSGWYAITVLQGNICDSAMLQYRSLLPSPPPAIQDK